MRILLDENFPADFAALLVGHAIPAVLLAADIRIMFDEPIGK
jgi:hypothetical protein